MVRLSLALTFFLAADASALSISAKAKAKSEFMAKMKQVVRDHDLDVAQFSLKEKIVSNSNPVKALRSVRVLEEQAEAAEEEEQVEEAEEAEEAAEEAEEEAEEAEEEAEEAEEEEVEEAEEAEEEVEEAEEEIEEEQAEVEYYSADDESEEYDAKTWGHDDAYDFSNSTFDIADYSLKYHSCRSLSNVDLNDLSAEQNEEEGVYPFTTTQVVNFRLCPTDTCQDDSWQGCRNTYGNYMITLEDYFETTQEHEKELFEQYCDYCTKCVYFYNYFNAECTYYDTCSDYSDVCAEENQEEGEEEEELDYSEFLECTEVEVLSNDDDGNNQTYYEQEVAYENGYNRRAEENDEGKVYLKIFCDGSLRIGIFSDNECSNYIGDTTSIYSSTGLSISEDTLQAEFTSHDCVSCGKKKSTWYFPNYNNEGENENEENESYEICENLYEQSAKCDMYLPIQKEEEDENEEDDEKTTCTFIEAVSRGYIDNYGNVKLSSKYDFFNTLNNEYLPDGVDLTDNQFIGIIAGTLACVALTIYGIKMRPNIQGNDLKTNLVTNDKSVMA